MPESNEQNLIVIEAFLEAAKRYARGGYDVIVDGIVGLSIFRFDSFYQGFFSL